MKVNLIEGKSQGLDVSKEYGVNHVYIDKSIRIIIYGYGIGNTTKTYVFKKEEYTVYTCPHTLAKDDICVECGQLIFATETRACGECECFHERPYKGWPTCGKRMMEVTNDMKVYYRIVDGSCFVVSSTGAKI